MKMMSEEFDKLGMSLINGLLRTKFKLDQS